ncbi:MAG TPA: hypothetical protein VEC13_00175 [Candidatus Paceibacterota bacterium]|nr:hypothetical protein [Candidatus Paceibacterota bacterium]
MDKNPTKKCPECLAEVPAQAKKCSHCGSKLPQPTSPLVKLLVVVLAIGFFSSIILASIGGGSSSSPEPDQPTAYDYELSARAYSEMYVERILKSPSTAEFCRGTATDLGENKWKVSSCVDSQNSFGATLRSNWEAIMVYTGGDPDNVASWKPEKITFDGKVVYQE